MNNIFLDKLVKKIFFTFFITVLNYYNCNATDWYASPDGDGNGTLLSPFNLQTALSSQSINPGDNLWLFGGTYLGRFICNLNGTPSAKITISSLPGQWAILNGNILPNSSSDEQVLSVKGGYVRFKEFEITYTNVIRYEGTPNFALCAGIEHTSGEDCEFINLIIHDNPGKGVGTWKESGGTFFYGCIIYNNGYIIVPQDPSQTQRGHGPGFYIQNKSDKFRVFKNNIVFNNFHDGFECFSASATADFEYHKNVTIDDNIVFNNGSPIRFNQASRGDNNINVSNYSSNGTNIIKNINIVNNVLYHNTNYIVSTPPVVDYDGNVGEACSLLIGNEYPPCPAPLNESGYGSENIFVKNNFISGRNNFINLKNVKTITFEDNYCLGRYILVDERNKYSSKINPTNWKFERNYYYTYNGGAGYCNPPGAYSVFRMTHVDYDGECKAIESTLVNTDYYLYNYTPHNENQNCYSYDWVEDFGIDLTSYWRHFWLSKNPSRCGGSSHGPWNNPPSILSLTQNQFKVNQFKIALLFDSGKFPQSPPNDSCSVAFVPNSSTITVDFSLYGYNIPDGTTYIIKDVENLSNQNPITGTILGNQITFDLNTPGFDVPKGSDFTNFSIKTPENFGVFLVEFGGLSLCLTNKNVSNSFPSGCLDFEQASNLINSTSLINSGTVAVYHAGNSVILTNGFHAKKGSRFRAHIEGCSQLFVGRVRNLNQMNESENTEENYQTDELISIYPNPSSGFFTVSSISGFSIKEIKVNSVDKANILFDKEYINEKVIDVDLSKEKAGIYIIQVTFENNLTTTRKVIKR